MVNQAQVNGSAKPHKAADAFRQNLGSLLHDVIELGELQFQLLQVDLDEARRGSVVPIILVVAALVLALGSVPVLLLGLGWTLVTFAGWTQAAAFAATGAGAVLLAGALAWLAWVKLYSAIGTLSRSGQEFTTNVHWIKDALKQTKTPSRRQSTSSATFHDPTQERTSLR